MLPRLGTPVFRGEDVSSWRKQVGVVSTGALLASSSAVAGVGSRALTPARELRGGGGASRLPLHCHGSRGFLHAHGSLPRGPHFFAWRSLLSPCTTFSLV